MTEVHLLFFHSVLQVFINTNKFLQSEAPLIHVLHSVLNSFLFKLSARFLHLKKLKDTGLITVDLEDESNYKSDEQLDIGMQTRSALKSLQHDGYPTSKIDAFFHAARSFYKQALTYGCDNLPTSDPVFINAQFLDFSKREHADFIHVEYFVDRFSLLSPFKSDIVKMERLKDEFIEYQLLDSSCIPNDFCGRELNHVKDQSESEFCTCIHVHVDAIWSHIKSMMLADLNPRFPNLCQVAELVIVIPHSNGSEERVFSLVTKNKTQYRPNLDIGETLAWEALLLPKLHFQTTLTLQSSS